MASKGKTMSQWTLNLAKTNVGFSLKHLMFSTVKGTFSKVSSSLLLNEEHFDQSSVKVEVETKTVSTNDKDRDLYLIGDDFFNPSKFPLMTFQSKKIKGEFTSFTIEGDLTIKDRTQAVSLKGTLSWVNSDKNILMVKANGKVNRKDFGLSWNALMETGGVLVGENVNIEIEAQYDLSK